MHPCRIETVDGQPIESCSQLVLKIFDDRFMDMPNPYDEDGVILEDNETITSFLSLSSFVTAEWHVRGELTAYEKMKVAQGSIIPYFYGAHEVKSSSLELLHQFRLASGHKVYGVLMEYIDASPLDNGVASKWSEKSQAELVWPLILSPNSLMAYSLFLRCRVSATLSE